MRHKYSRINEINAVIAGTGTVVIATIDFTTCSPSHGDPNAGGNVVVTGETLVTVFCLEDNSTGWMQATGQAARINGNISVANVSVRVNNAQGPAWFGQNIVGQTSGSGGLSYFNILGNGVAGKTLLYMGQWVWNILY